MSISLNNSVFPKNQYPVEKEENTLITSLSTLQKQLPQFNAEIIQSLLNVQRGPEGGQMKTLGLVKCVNASQAFMLDGKTIKISHDFFSIDLEKEACNPRHVVIPHHLEFIAEWNKTAISSGEGNNILGDNGGLYFQQSHVQIPKIAATQETLAYYGAFLIPENTPIRFTAEEPYPLWKMNVEANYINDFIMQEKLGGGFYLEFHHDQPHFHMQINGGGYYLLAKQTCENTFHITAFELSNGQAIYTKKGAIHCDAALTGDLIVGYTASNDCSTVLLRTKAANEMVNIEFIVPCT